MRSSHPDYAAALVNKRWDLLAELKLQRERDAKRTGIAGALRIMSELRDHAKALRPSWPGESDREEDLETHRQVAATLARANANAARARVQRRPARVR